MSVRRLAPPELQPKSFAFTAENLAWAKAEMAKYPPGRQASAIIPLLWRPMAVCMLVATCCSVALLIHG